MALSEQRLRAVLAWVVIAVIAGPVGGAVWLGIAHGDSPCILCWAQRTSMALIGLTGLFVLRYGPRPRYLGTAILLGAWGMFMALRHSALHLARDVGQGFSAPILGLHTYAWSWIIHFVALVVVGKLFLFQREEPLLPGVRPLTATGRVAMGLFLVVISANAVQAFVSTGPPPFIGQGDPVRFSLNPKHWVWSREETEGRISLRGAWTIPAPDVATLDADPAHGPLAALPALGVNHWLRIGPPLEGTLSDLAFDSASGQFLAVTDREAVYLLDSSLNRVTASVTLDPGFSIDLSPLAGAAFMGDTLALLATNKSYVLLRRDPAADEGAMWRRFLATSGGVTELGRSRFATVRARQMYVMSLAFDPAAQELITIAVPSARQRRLVVSRFARGDLVLASEFVPRLDSALTTRGATRSIAEYVVTGAAIHGRNLYAISAAYSTLLVIDLDSRTVRAAYAVPGLVHPVGLAVRGGNLLIAQEDGRVAVLDSLP